MVKIVWKYEVIYGFNTKQLWVIDNENKKMIEIPAFILQELKAKYPGDLYRQEQALEDVLDYSEPSWLFDADYIHDIDYDI